MRSLVCLLAFAACSSEDTLPEPSPGCDTMPARPKLELRGAWIASVQNIDWPSRPGMTPAEQQAEFRQLADEAVRMGLNTLFVQIRPTADAFYPSALEPWSQWLTGTQGQDPGYDPLGFLVTEAHARNLELHAWFNPYRVSMQTDPTQLVPSHPGRQHPDWLRTYGGKLYFDPGLPEVRDHIEQCVLDVVNKYDIDGVHFDDYFYPYPVMGETFADDDTYAQHGMGIGNKDDWRRQNIDLLVSEVQMQVHAAKPYVQFGISPFGIWRNQSSDPTGSDTHGLESYSSTYSDTRAWIQNGWIDYVVPQVYWNIGYTAADYAVLVPWWAHEVAGTDVRLYIGQATYRIGAVGQAAAWSDPQEMLRHLQLDAQQAVGGEVFFSMTNLVRDPLGTTDLLEAGPFAHPALLPPIGKGDAPTDVGQVFARTTPGGIQLSWASPATAVAYAIYRIPGDGPVLPCQAATADQLVATVRQAQWLDPSVQPGQTVSYLVTALDRMHHESAPSSPVTVTP